MLAAIFWFVEVACFSTLFPNLEECKWDLNNLFSHCIFSTACLCLHESAPFMTLKTFLNKIFVPKRTLITAPKKNISIVLPFLGQFSLNLRSSRQFPISYIFPKKFSLLIIVPEAILFQNHEISTSQNWTTSRDVNFSAWKNWINTEIGTNSKFRY